MNNEKVKALEKKLKVDKIVITILSVVLGLGMLGGMSLTFMYFNRNNAITRKFVTIARNTKNNIMIKISDIDKNYKENNHNATSKLKLTSAYGDNQGTHPKILYFKDGWNGYKYWLVFSPYPFSDDKRENPHIKVSNDLVNFTEPKGFENPLEDFPENYNSLKVYNSDPHLVYNSDTNELECYYRFVNDKEDKVIVYRRTTKDGINWTPKEEILKSQRSKKDYVSFAIIYNDGLYEMWYVDKNNTLTYENSTDGKTYDNRKRIKLNYFNPGLKTWHLDVIKTDIGYEMITVAFENWSGRASMSLYYTVSNDNENWKVAQAIIKPSNISWDNGGLYRSTFIKIDGIYYVYYSGISKDGARGIGLSYGEDIYNLKGYNGKITN